MLKLSHFLSLAFSSAFMGGCIIVAVVLVPFWQSMEPIQFLKYFEQWASNIGITMLLLEIVAQVFLLIAIRDFGDRSIARRLWIMSTIAFAFTFLIFFMYFAKINYQMMNSMIDPLLVPAELKLWRLMHGTRTGFAMISLVFSITSMLSLSKRKN